MDIKSTKFPGHPVFHAIDAPWGSDNGVNFNFHLENEAEARMYVAGLIPFIRYTMGEQSFNGFSVEAVKRHADSVFDARTKEIYSNTDVWVNTSLALDEECNFTGIPGDMEANQENEQTLVDTPTFFRDTDSVSTFCSKYSTNHKPQQHINIDNEVNNTMLDSINISKGPEVSGISEVDPRLDTLEKNFEKVTSSFTSTINRISAQQGTTERNFQNLFHLLERANLFQPPGRSTINEPLVLRLILCLLRITYLLGRT
jgi:hypothetical protein